MSDPRHIEKLRSLLGGSEDSLSRLGAPLWARVGKPLGIADLSWARSFGREDAPQVVWNALLEAGAVSGEPSVLRSAPLAQVFLSLTSPHAPRQSRTSPEPTSRLVWTLPATILPAMPSRRQTYLQAVISVIDNSRETLLCVSPYLDTPGVGLLFAPLMNALARGVEVTILTHDALNPTSFTGAAIEELRREARRTNGTLTVYSADAGSGPDRREHPLLHAKLVVADKQKVAVGSCNLTSHAFSSNLEAGTVLGPEAAEEAIMVISYLIRSHLVYLVFGTGVPGTPYLTA